MNDFTFIAPEDWTPTPDGFVDLIPSGISSVQTWIDTQTWYALEEELHNNDLLPLNHHILEARLFNGEILMLRLAIE